MNVTTSTQPFPGIRLTRAMPCTEAFNDAMAMASGPGAHYWKRAAARLLGWS